MIKRGNVWMPRKAAISWKAAIGVPFDWPDDAAAWNGERLVTWKEFHDTRRRRQRQILDRKRRIDEQRLRPCYVWSFYVPGDLFTGWWCYVILGDHRYNENCVDVRGKYGLNEKLAVSIMRAIPLGVWPSLLSTEDTFAEWMPKFAQAFPRRHKRDKRNAGTRVGWLLDRREFSLERAA
jgi:hypothetical protein